MALLAANNGLSAQLPLASDELTDQSEFEKSMTYEDESRWPLCLLDDEAKQLLPIVFFRCVAIVIARALVLI